MAAYTRMERTRAMYAVLLLLVGQSCKLHLRESDVEFAVLVTVEILSLIHI